LYAATKKFLEGKFLAIPLKFVGISCLLISIAEKIQSRKTEEPHGATSWAVVSTDGAASFFVWFAYFDAITLALLRRSSAARNERASLLHEHFLCTGCGQYGGVARFFRACSTGNDA
jgi:hypothetical protein